MVDHKPLPNQAVKTHTHKLANAESVSRMGKRSQQTGPAYSVSQSVSHTHIHMITHVLITAAHHHREPRAGRCHRHLEWTDSPARQPGQTHSVHSCCSILPVSDCATGHSAY